MPYTTILDDYLRSAPFYDRERTREFIARSLQVPIEEGPSAETMDALRPHADYLDAAFHRIASHHGGVEEYFRHCDIDPTLL